MEVRRQQAHCLLCLFQHLPNTCPHAVFAWPNCLSGVNASIEVSTTFTGLSTRWHLAIALLRPGLALQQDLSSLAAVLSHMRALQSWSLVLCHKYSLESLGLIQEVGRVGLEGSRPCKMPGSASRASSLPSLAVSAAGCYVYGRSFNPTVRNLGRVLARLEDTEAAHPCASGKR